MRFTEPNKASSYIDGLCVVPALSSVFSRHHLRFKPKGSRLDWGPLQWSSPQSKLAQGDAAACTFQRTLMGSPGRVN